MEKRAFVKACLKTLDTPQLTEDMVANRAVRMIHSGQLVGYGDMLFRAKTAQAEAHLASMVKRQLISGKTYSYNDLDQELLQEEGKLHIRLAPEQKEAVKMALSSGLSIVTGGPGTGKTLIQKAILDIYRRNNPGKEICCCAPTGRAARRMEQSTGYPASTVHKALGILAGDDGEYGAPEVLDADLVLVDEVSMLDIYLAGHLFDALKYGCQVVLIGDADQLPSVGPGAVLKELIASGKIPVARLDRVYRQSAGSRIAANARLIRHGSVGLEYGSDFEFLDSASISESAQTIADLYLQEIGRYGVDNVALLSPFRQKTETGVNALNEVLRDKVNPPAKGKAEVAKGSRLYRVGDKVMQNKNHEDISNGDIGYVVGIYRSGEECTVRVDFGDGRVADYDSSDLDMLDLGYALTIHKS
ncbi:MAG: ATP-dependent RecD-like DNA helicase, partial [Faecousia sp.]